MLSRPDRVTAAKRTSVYAAKQTRPSPTARLIAPERVSIDRRRLISVVIGVLGVLLLCAPSAAQGEPATFAGFCNAATAGPLSISETSGFTSQLIATPDRVEAVTSPSFGGRCSMQITAESGDLGGDTDRDEIAAPHALWHDGDDVWYTLAFMLGPDPLPQPGGWLLVHQFFAQDIANDVSGGSPPLDVELTSEGDIAVTVRGGVKDSASAAAPENTELDIAPATSGVWHVLMIHVVWSTSSNGEVQVWHSVDGESFMLYPKHPRLARTYTRSAATPARVSETGIYRSHTSSTQYVDYGGLTAEPTEAEALTSFGGATVPASGSGVSNTSATPPVSILPTASAPTRIISARREAYKASYSSQRVQQFGCRTPLSQRHRKACQQKRDHGNEPVALQIDCET